MNWTDQKPWPRVVIVGSAVVASMIAAGLWVYGDITHLNADAGQYMSVAAQVLRDGTLATSLLYYDVHYAFSALPAPQTVFPPAFSLLIAAVGFWGFSLVDSILLVNVGALVLTGVLLFLVLVRLEVEAWAAALAGVVVVALAANWQLVLAGNSEVVFGALTMLSLYALTRSASMPSSTLWPVLSGAAAGVGFAVRYQGLFFLAAAAIVLLVGAARARPAGIRRLVAFGVPAATVFVAILTRNYRLTGTMGGGPIDDASAGESLLVVAHSFYWQMSGAFGLSVEGLLRGQVAELSLLVACGLAVLLVPRIDRRGLARVSRNMADATMMDAVAASYLLLTVAALVVLAVVKSVAYVQLRFLLPLVPFGLIVLARIASGASLPRSRVGLACVGMAVFAIVAGQIRVGTADARNGVHLAIETALEQPLNGGTVGQLLTDELASGRPVFATHSQYLGQWSEGAAVLGAGPALYSDRTWDAQMVQRMMREYDARLVVLLPSVFDSTAAQNANRGFFAEMRAGTADMFEPMIANDDVWLLRLTEAGALNSRPAD